MSLLIERAKAWIASGVPERWPCTHLREEGLRGCFFEGVPLRGEPTRVFAWLGLPEGATAEAPVPAMVLIHGGGGTAFARWVRWWNARGYAAIAMDTCGAMPLPDTGVRGAGRWPRHSWSGPAGWGGFQQGDEAPEDQWMYHACAAIVRGHSLLAAEPAVDASRIGVTGISWGGLLTCHAAGLDPRFRCAAPVYGCGFVSELGPWADGGALAQMPDAARRFWREHWDPGQLLPRATLPMLWLIGTNDFAFWPPVWQKSATATAGARQLCCKLRWPHGHIPEAEETRELLSFVDAHLKGAPPLLSISEPVIRAGSLQASVSGERELRAAHLLVTVEDGPWPQRQWHQLPAQADAARQTIQAPLPAGWRAACLGCVSDEWLYATSDFVFA